MNVHNEGANINFKPDKDNELKAVFEYLQHHVATATMVATTLKIYRPNLCRHKRQLEKAGLLFEVNKGLCKVTKCKASYLTAKTTLPC